MSLDTVIKELKLLAAGEGEYTPSGICALMRDHNVLSLRYKHLFERLDEFSGYHAFPVPHPTLKPPEAFCRSTSKSLWEGEYGASRRRLAGFLVEQLEGKR